MNICHPLPLKILIVKIGAIGDVITCLHLLTYYKKEFPNAHITWIVGSAAEPILKMTAMVDEILVVDEARLFQGSWVVRLKEILHLQMKLFGKRFNRVLICHRDWRYKILTSTVFCRKKVSLVKNSTARTRFANIYRGVEYLQMAFDIVKPDIDQFPLPILNLFEKESINTNLKQIVIVPGGAENILANNALRRWPIENYVSLVKKLVSFGYEISIAGSQTDEWVIPYFSSIPHNNFVGKTDLNQLARLLKKSRLLITHDCGPLHLARLIRCATIALFGPTNPIEVIGLDQNIKVLWPGKTLSCSPCYNGKHFAKCGENRCIKMITPQEVFEVIQKHSIDTTHS
jgi:heptosyltransferase-2